jgi:glycosyltransferase involved in cell wall biosynthesis
MEDNKIKLLVIPGLFPQYPDDIQGVFILDYIKSVEKYCDIKVFDSRISGNDSGLKLENIDSVKVYRYAVTTKKANWFSKPFLYLIWFYQGWKISSKFHDIDLIHAHGCRPYGTLALLISKKLKIPVIITEHTGPFSKVLKTKLSKLISKISLENSSAVLTVSEDLKRQINDASIYPKKIFVTYNPVDIELFNTRDKIEIRKCKNILYVGRLEDYKGGFRALLAFNKVFRKYPDWTFTIIGDGPQLREIKSFIRENEVLSNFVILKGQLKKEEISYEMKKASFFVFPSEHETFGIVIAEAMSSGLPVIVGNETAPKEFVDSDSGVLVPPKNIDAIANAMECMINNISNYDSELIRKKIVSRFSFEEFGKKLNQIYREFV